MFCHRHIRLRLFSQSTPTTVCAIRRCFASQGGDSAFGALTYEQFINGIGKTFEKAHSPRQWLGGNVPFPMNPSFKPPIPISDSLRTLVYRKYMLDPEKNSVRELARQHSLSIKRVDAILRLKGMEESWIKKKPLQTGFLVGMEELLGVNARKSTSHVDFGVDTSRHDVNEADTLEEAEGGDWARQKYRRMFWESISEGEQEPVMPTHLQKAREEMDRQRKLRSARKVDPTFLPRHGETPKTVVVTRPHRPTMKFVDVGGKFINLRDQMRRMAASKRRAQFKAKKKKARE